MTQSILDTISRIVNDVFISVTGFASEDSIISDDNFIQASFKCLKSNITDDHRRLVKETGPHIANIIYRPATFGNSTISIDIGDMGIVFPIYFRKFGIAFAASTLIYAGIEEIRVHTEYGSYVNPIGILLDFWGRCNDGDMIEWFLENDVYTNVPKEVLCDEWITVNAKAQRNEIVMRLLRWKHDNLGSDEKKEMRL